MDNKKRSFLSATMGFTLVELTIIIVLIAIFAAIAMTRVRSGLSNIQVQVAIDQITSDIDLAKSMAFARHDTITIVYAPAQERYSIYTGPDGSRAIISDFPYSESGVISFDNARFIDVDITGASFNGSPELQFLPLGEPKTGGSVTLNSKTITIENITGRWSLN